MDRLKVLVVDDESRMRKLVKDFLLRQNYEVLEAENGEEGIQKYKEENPDMVTMDITMPVKDGLEALKEIKNFDSAAKVIMVTAAGQESKVMEAVKLGAAEFVTKPFEKEKIVDTVHKVVNN